MPQYRAIDKGFYNGELYGPTHRRRRIVHTEKPLKPVPAWLELMEPEKPDEAKLRQRRTAAQKRADKEQQAEQEKMVKEVTFVNDPAPAKSSTVETL